MTRNALTAPTAPPTAPPTAGPTAAPTARAAAARRGAAARGAAGGAGNRGAGNRGPAGSSRRQQILAAAAPLFARRGFHGVSVDDLGAAAGVSGPALYRHFPSKEAILAELLVGVSERLLAGGLARASEAAKPGAALAALVEWHVEFALDNADVIRVQTRDLDSLPSPARRQVRSLQQRYVAAWAIVIAEVTGCGGGTAVAAAHAAFGLVNSTPHSARLPRGEMAALLQVMALGALGAAAPAAAPLAGRRAPGRGGAISARRTGRGT